MDTRKPTKLMIKRALIVMLAVCILAFGADTISLFRVQIIKGEEYKSKAESQQLSDTVINAERGTIYDCNRNVLAQSATAWQIYLVPSKIEDEEMLEGIVKGLSEILELDEETVRNKASQSQYNYVSIKRGVENDVKQKVTELISANRGYNKVIGIDPDVKRYYPNNALASTILGFTGADDIGRAGVEQKYNGTLTGISGRIITAKNASSDQMPNQYESTYDAQNGSSLVLTIDEVAQYYLEKSLEQVAINSNATSASGILMDVNTGAIIAMSKKPDYNCNEPHELRLSVVEKIEALTSESEKNTAKLNEQYAQWRNNTISDTYEPGSVFKLITAAAVLEENTIPDNFTFVCSGSIRIADRTYSCHNRAGHGTQDFTHALMNSCNPYFITIGQKLGAQKFFKYFEAFGFTEETGIDLPAEAKAVANVTYHTEQYMGITELASCSFGQSFQVSAIQMITAISAIANGGKLLKPYIVDSVLDSENNVTFQAEPTVRRQVISESTADKLTEMMVEVVSVGTAKNAYVSGYSVAGKTGTSQKLGTDGEYIASFGGFAPSDDPQVAIIIVIDNPTGAHGGGAVAAPVAAEVLENVLTYMNIEPQYTEEELAQLGVETPNVIGETVSGVKSDLRNKGMQVKVIGSGDTVVSQIPEAGKLMPKKGVVVLYTEQTTTFEKVAVPNFTNLTMLQANSLALANGLNVRIQYNTSTSSTLMSYRQSVAAGTMVDMGSVITVSFKTNTGVSDLAGDVTDEQAQTTSPQ